MPVIFNGLKLLDDGKIYILHYNWAKQVTIHFL